MYDAITDPIDIQTSIGGKLRRILCCFILLNSWDFFSIFSLVALLIMWRLFNKYYSNIPSISISLRTQSECGEIRIRITPNAGKYGSE